MGRKKLELPDPIDGQVYQCGSTHRRVIRLFNDRVFYSVGSDKNRSCELHTFKRWARKAEITHTPNATA